MRQPSEGRRGWVGVDYSPPVVTQSNPSRPADGRGTPRRSTSDSTETAEHRRPRVLVSAEKEAAAETEAKNSRCLPSLPLEPSPSPSPSSSPSPSLCGASAIGYGRGFFPVSALENEQTKANCPPPQPAAHKPRPGSREGGRRRSYRAEADAARPPPLRWFSVRGWL